jgi:hypothetical protein
MAMWLIGIDPLLLLPFVAAIATAAKTVAAAAAQIAIVTFFKGTPFTRNVDGRE